MSKHYRTRGLRWLAAVAFVVTGVLWLACQEPVDEGAKSTTPTPEARFRPTPAPPFASIDRAEREEVIAYARGLTFDSMTHRAADRQALVYRDRTGEIRVGALATITPEVGVHLSSADALANGRIVARIVSDRAAPDLGIPSGISYLWADRITVDGATGAGRSLIIPEDPALPIDERPLVVRANLGYINDRPIARWVVDSTATTSAGWWACEKGYCCER